MQTYTNLFSFIRSISILLIHTFILSGVFPLTLVHATTSYGYGHDIFVDSSSNLYTTGSFESTADFDPGSATFNLTSAGRTDIFISKLDSNGNFVWAKTMGGTLSESGRGISVDSSGNVYTAGTFQGTADFDPGPATFNLTSAGRTDIFVSKLDSNGNFIWAKAMGGTSRDDGLGDIAVDSSGNVYNTGSFEGTADFDPGPATFNLTSRGSKDIFISKLDSNGNFVWAKAMGGTSWDSGYGGIAVDTAGNVYTTGAFWDTADFDPGPGTFNLTGAGYWDIFISKLDSNGNFIWAKAMGGVPSDFGRGISVDNSGNVYTTGSFEGTADFDPGPATFKLRARGVEDIFVSKLDSNGNFVWAKAMGATYYDFGSDIAVDGSGNVYTTGQFYYTVDFDPGPGTFNLTSRGSKDIFISKLDSNGNFVWAKAMGGVSRDQGFGISVCSSDNVYTTGFFRFKADFDPGPETFNLPSTGNYDIFISKLDSNGNFVWAKGIIESAPFPWNMFLPAIIGNTK